MPRQTRSDPRARKVLQIATDREVFDFGGVVKWGADSTFMQPIMDRASAELQHFKQISNEELRQGMAEIGYRPLGLYLPEDKAMAALYRTKAFQIGDIEDLGDRLDEYFKLQDETELLQKQGVPGKWHGQQALARSLARYRIAAWGRRGGKTFHTAREAVAVLKKKAQSVVWVCGRTMESVERCFSEISRVLISLGENVNARRWRDSEQEKLIELENGSVVMGVSLESNVAGLAVDLAIVEEARYVLREQWIHEIRPTLTDKMGRAILISSLDGDNFFVEQYREALAQREADIAAGKEPGQIEWDAFKDPSWEVNFAAFAKGRQSEAMQSEERGMQPREFLEIYGAVIMPSKYLVFPEFRQRVHVGRFPWNPRLEVILTGDPSGGANAYAVDVLQDYGDKLVQIDEVHELGGTANAEAVNDILRGREWCMPDLSNIKTFLIDSAASDDIRRLGNMGWPVEAVFDKPEIWKRLPVMRNLLREPGLYKQVLDMYMAAIRVDMGIADDDELTPDQEYKLQLQLEEALADDNMTEQDCDNLGQCAQFFVDQTCFHTIEEFSRYRYNENRNPKNVREVPMDRFNHHMDAIGYYIWQFKRFDAGLPRQLGDPVNVRGTVIYLNLQPGLRGVEQVTVQPVQPPDNPDLSYKRRMAGFLATMRDRYENSQPDYSLLARG